MTDKPPLPQVLKALADKTVECPDCHFRGTKVKNPAGCSNCNGTSEILDPMFALLRVKCDHGSHVLPHGGFHKVSVRGCRWCAHIRDCSGWTTATESQAADAMGRMMELWPFSLDPSWVKGEVVDWTAFKTWIPGAGPLEKGKTPWDAFYRACAQAAEGE